MKKLMFAVLVVAVAVFTISCTRVEIKAPAGKQIVLASGGKPQATAKKRIFYLFGLVPLNDNSTVDLINEVGGDKVVIEAQSALLTI